MMSTKVIERLRGGVDLVVIPGAGEAG